MANEFTKALRYGIDQPTENLATTLEALGFDAQAKATRGLIDAPENYESAAARFMNPEGEGYNWRDLPLATVEQAGQLGGSLLSRAGGAAIGGAAGPGGAIIGGLLGPGLFEAVQIAGPVALERARNNGREEPTGEDWLGALGTAGFSGVLNAIGVKNIGMLNSTVGKTLQAGVTEGITEGLQGVTEQVGSTALTDEGLNIDPKQALGEGLLGTSAGTAIQGPIAVKQAMDNMGFSLDTPEEAVETMDQTVNNPLETELFEPGIQEYEQQVAPPDLLDEQNVQATQSDRDIFVETQENYINSFIDNHYGLGASENIMDGPLEINDRANVLMNVQDYIRANFELYDSREPQNTPERIRQNLDSIIQTEINTQARAGSINVDVVGERDTRFDVPNRTIQDVYAPADPAGPIRTRLPKVPKDSSREGITSIETGVDPVFMTQSVILGNDPEAPLGVLNNLPKIMTAADAMQKLGIKEQTDGNWFEPSNQKMVPIANEAINTEVASFLKTKKDQKENVTREQIRDVMHDSLSRHRTIVTRGRETQHQGRHTYRNLGDLFPGLDYIRDSVEKWSQYDARLPKGEQANESLYMHQIDDGMHSPHGAGANMWWRGFNVNDPMGEGEGILLAENQSNLHGHSQSKQYEDLYLSDFKAAQEGRGSERIQKIKDRQTRFDLTESVLVEKIGNTLSNSNLEAGFVQTISDLARGKGDGLESSSVAIEQELGRISPEYKKEMDKLNADRKAKIDDAALRAMEVEQPFGELGFTLKYDELKSVYDNFHLPPFPTTYGATNEAPTVRGAVVEALKQQREGYDAIEEAITETEVAKALSEVDHLTMVEFVKVNEKTRAEKSAFSKKYLPAFAEKYPIINDLIIQGKAYPTEAEIKEVQDFEYSRQIGATNVRPDYPFKNNNAAMNVRSAIVEAIDSGKSFLFLGSSGYGGAPSSPYKMQLKEAERIAKQIGKLTDTKPKEIFKMAKGIIEKTDRTVGVPEEGTVFTFDNEWKDEGGPYYRLDLRQLKQLIDAKIFPGFVGYKKGGLVTKGTGYSMNYGDYGRSYK